MAWALHWRPVVSYLIRSVAENQVTWYSQVWALHSGSLHTAPSVVGKNIGCSSVHSVVWALCSDDSRVPPSNAEYSRTKRPDKMAMSVRRRDGYRYCFMVFYAFVKVNIDKYCSNVSLSYIFYSGFVRFALSRGES